MSSSAVDHAGQILSESTVNSLTGNGVSALVVKVASLPASQCMDPFAVTLSCEEGGAVSLSGSCQYFEGEDCSAVFNDLLLTFNGCVSDGWTYDGGFAAATATVTVPQCDPSKGIVLALTGSGDLETTDESGQEMHVTSLSTNALFPAEGGMTFLNLSGTTQVGGFGCSVKEGEAFCGVDTDGDGTPDTADNCPDLSNPSQADADGDGIGSLCDTDEGPGSSSGLEDCQNGQDDNGDGLIDCDDAACAGTTVCLPSGPPSVAVCGDSFYQPDLGELCDFSVSPDGCDVGVCSLSCTSCVGDGHIAGFEQCDDGNTANGDGCSSNGATEAGWVCNGAEPSVCAPQGPEVCGNDVDDDGDGIYDCKDPDCANDPLCKPPAEICDNQIDDDGDQEIDCKDSDCWVLNGVCLEVCAGGNDEDGDGAIDCDDSDCAEDPACKLCGNGRIDGTSGEQCDPNLGDAGGSQACIDRFGAGVCDPNTCQCCGDGTCTDGETAESCAEDCALPPPSCGDGVCSQNEDPVACPHECGGEPGCGDGVCNGAGGEDVTTCPADCGKIVCQTGGGVVATVCDGKAECDAYSFIPAGYDEIACSGDKVTCPAGTVLCDTDQKCYVPCDGVQGCATSDLAYNDEGPLWCGEVCDDGSDNEFDGKTDCDDPDCVYDPACFKETDCTDKTDNDGDGKTDCDDTDCAKDPACVPPSETDCKNAVDDDNDGKTDCEDSDCWSGGVCPEICTGGNDEDGDTAVDCNDSDCAADKACAITSEAGLCKNGLDDDGDKAIDCADSDCWVKGGNCAEVCTGGNDEDGDGAVDCDDTDCAADAACVPASEVGLCKNGLDDDKDGASDCGDSDCWTKDVGCAEVCTGGNDEDADGAVDCADSDCATDKSCPPPK